MYNPYNPSVELEDMVRGFKAVLSNQENYTDTTDAIKYEINKRYKQVLIDNVPKKSLSTKSDKEAIEELFNEDNFDIRDLFELEMKPDVDVSSLVVKFNIVDTLFIGPMLLLVKKSLLDIEDYQPIVDIYEKKNYIELFEIRFMDNTVKGINNENDIKEMSYYLNKLDADFKHNIKSTTSEMISIEKDTRSSINNNVFNKLRYKYNIFGYRNKIDNFFELKDNYMNSIDEMMKEWRKIRSIIKITLLLMNNGVLNKFLSEFKYDLEKIFNSKFELVR